MRDMLTIQKVREGIEIQKINAKIVRVLMSHLEVVNSTKSSEERNRVIGTNYCHTLGNRCPTKMRPIQKLTPPCLTTHLGCWEVRPPVWWTKQSNSCMGVIMRLAIRSAAQVRAFHNLD